MAVHGRGAQSASVPTRFGLATREADGDWLDDQGLIDGPLPKLRTTVTEEFPRTVLTFNSSPDIPFDRSVNAYRGCEHGCIYCYARPTHAYHDLSPGLDFETKLFAKPQSAEILRRTFAKRGYVPKPIAMGTNTDPYQPIETRYRITRSVLELCLEVGHPVTITTKSARVLDDLDLIAELARRRLIAVGISVTTLDARLSNRLEPRASTPEKRLAALGRLVEAGVPAHVSVSPIIPSITDQFLEEILVRAGALGVRSASWIIVRLPHEVAPLFREWLKIYFPDRADKVMHTVQSMRGGKDYDSSFHTRMKPNGVWADLIRSRFRIALRKAGITQQRHDLDCSQFRAPSADGQLTLL
ncbi:PA0069 family radical SAM protein [Novosphingobium cyanobacteriorum]|uniref:PA0069 family radical SAM protein n=1 Tax=Novosphingobium cyanobacteriorum TaxID=3024215 RepID=A0ABT6CJ14_9SPHN|nr:PA0069 family radical SAM protein [Novosphingobium cyanobacteriorum]MDF8333913.1 PA0069 family radical SAM protein [Novosphingobium cyanobacteriorum]